MNPCVSAMSLGGGDGEEGLAEAMREKCRGDLHTRGCDKCKKAMGQMRVHKHGTSNSQSVLKVDLSGPHPKRSGHWIDISRCGCVPH
eukprot:12906713-Prorocentrum_lima.AAC.1